MSMLDYNHESSYTPDYTANLMSFVNLTATQFLTDKLLLSGNVYYRHLITDAVNGNTNDSYLDGDYSGPALDCAAPGASLSRVSSRFHVTHCCNFNVPLQIRPGKPGFKHSGFEIRLSSIASLRD